MTESEAEVLVENLLEAYDDYVERAGDRDAVRAAFEDAKAAIYAVLDEDDANDLIDDVLEAYEGWKRSVGHRGHLKHVEKLDAAIDALVDALVNAA